MTATVVSVAQAERFPFCVTFDLEKGGGDMDDSRRFPFFVPFYGYFGNDTFFSIVNASCYAVIS